jgi:hypothetical protein
MTEARELLRAANPVPECGAPPIERLWERLALDAPPGLGARDASAPSRRRRANAWFGRLVVGLAAAVAIAIGVGAVVVLHAHPRASAPPATGTQTRPSAKPGLIGSLAVLRRPQTSADLDPALLRRLVSRPAGPGAGLMGTPVRSLIRLATVTPWGERVFFVPTRPLNRTAAAKVLAATKLPSAARRSVLRQLERQGSGLTLGINGAGGTTVAQIAAGDDWASSGPSPNTLIVVVPDGVARVTVQLAHRLTAIVHNNVAAFEPRQPIENLGVHKMTWYSPSGAIVKRPKATNSAFGTM